MKYTFNLIGYDTCEWDHVNDELKIEAETEQDAVKQAERWCSEHSFMGGYDWKIDSYSPRQESKEVYMRKCWRCGAEYRVSRIVGLPTICGCCASDISNCKIIQEK